MTNSHVPWDPQQYATHARFVAELGRDLIDLLDARAGQRVLDLGCGDGAQTAELTARGFEVVGVDASAAQVAAACERGLDARVVDGVALPFQSEFDAVFSNAALHWMKQPECVLEGVYRALRPGGRFVGEFGAAGNVGQVLAAVQQGLLRRGLDPAACHPWYFPTGDEYRQLLITHGFEVRSLVVFERPTLLPGELTNWLETFAKAFVHGWPDEDRADLFAGVADQVRPRLQDAEGRWWVDYVRLRFVAEKP